jgi:hypothetical protein
MRKIASIGLALAGLTVTALPALADSQAIAYATGMIGGAPAWAYDQQAQFGPTQYGTYWRAAPQVGRYAYVDPYAYDGYALSGGYSPRNCTYSGGPKRNDWTCWGAPY